MTMSKIGFIGIGNMGGPMARNLIKTGHDVTVFDLSKTRMAALKKDGAATASSASDAVTDADVVVTMLPAGTNVQSVYFNDVFENAQTGTLMIDCSTIDVATSRTVHTEAEVKGFHMVDAPVSGGVGGAEAGTLTFMVGGTSHAFDQAKPLLDIMGKNIVYCGGAGNGQAAKICNNMMLGIQMASVSEAFLLAEKLGLDADKLFNVSSTASGQCWSLTTYCPVPGPVPASPANNDYEPGFAAPLMKKDMGLAIEAADQLGVRVDAAKCAAAIYDAYVEAGGDTKDFSGIINHIRDTSN